MYGWYAIGIGHSARQGNWSRQNADKARADDQPYRSTQNQGEPARIVTATATIILYRYPDTRGKGDDHISRDNHLAYKSADSTVRPLWIGQAFNDKWLSNNQVDEVRADASGYSLHPAHPACNQDCA